MAVAAAAVTDTGPVIALHGVGRLGLLDELLDRLVVPVEVWLELVAKPGAEEPRALSQLQKVSFRPTVGPLPGRLQRLGRGEAAAIAQAASDTSLLCLLDDARARHVATGLGIQVRGTLGVLAEAKRRGLLRRVAPLIDQMIENGCRFAPGIVDLILRGVDER